MGFISVFLQNRYPTETTKQKLRNLPLEGDFRCNTVNSKKINLCFLIYHFFHLQVDHYTEATTTGVNKKVQVINHGTMKFLYLRNEKCNFPRITGILRLFKSSHLLMYQVIKLDAISLMRSNFEIKRMKRYLA